MPTTAMSLERMIRDDDSNSIVHVEDENAFNSVETCTQNKETDEERKIKRDARMGVFTNVRISPKKISKRVQDDNQPVSTSQIKIMNDYTPFSEAPETVNDGDQSEKELTLPKKKQSQPPISLSQHMNAQLKFLMQSDQGTKMLVSQEKRLKALCQVQPDRLKSRHRSNFDQKSLGKLEQTLKHLTQRADPTRQTQ